MTLKHQNTKMGCAAVSQSTGLRSVYIPSLLSESGATATACHWHPVTLDDTDKPVTSWLHSLVGVIQISTPFTLSGESASGTECEFAKGDVLPP